MNYVVLMSDEERRAFLTPVPTEVYYPHLARQAESERTPRDPDFCPHGHRRSPENVAVYVYGTKIYRVCRLCRSEQQRAYLQRRKERAQ